MSFIKIVNNAIQLNADIQIPVTDNLRVVTVVGKARMGKSTFLNSIVHLLEAPKSSKDPIPPFCTQDDINHCTRGMDYYYCDSESILFLDCQGLALEDSRHDPMLLLFAYLISDVIIVNERMMLQNEVLKLLEPICTFVTYIDLDTFPKPHLLFRISDCDIVNNPKQNLQRLMDTYNDQYQSIRNSIMHLFQPVIGVVKTDVMSKTAKASVMSNNYYALFREPSNGFYNAIHDILDFLPKGHSSSVWLATLPIFVQQINRNEKISIDKLDIVTQTAKYEIMTWERELSPTLFTNLEVDTLHSTYVRVVEPRITEMLTTTAEFDRRFKHMPESIRGPYYNSLVMRLSEPVDKAKHRMSDLAEEKIQGLIQSLVLSGTLCMDEQDWRRRSLPNFGSLRAHISELYEPVQLKYEAWMTKQETIFHMAVDEAKAHDAQQLDVILSRFASALAAFKFDAVERICKMKDFSNSDAMRTISCTTIQEELKTQRLVTIAKVERDMKFAQIHLLVRMSLSGITIKTTVGALAPIAPTDELVKPHYDTFVANLEKYEALYVALMEEKFRTGAVDMDCYKKRLDSELDEARNTLNRIRAEYADLQDKHDTYRRSHPEAVVDVRKEVPTARTVVVVASRARCLPCWGWFGRSKNDTRAV